MPKVTDAITGQPIFRGYPTAGLRNVGSYQVSGHALLIRGLYNRRRRKQGAVSNSH
jgi:hypothetical protein